MLKHADVTSCMQEHESSPVFFIKNCACCISERPEFLICFLYANVESLNGHPVQVMPLL